MLSNANPMSFFKDAFGIVHLAGVPFAIDGGGGDGICNNTDPSDKAIFVLPAGYQPDRLEVFPSGNTSVGFNLIAPAGGMMIEGFPVPGGTVLVESIADGNETALDGFTFRAAAGS